MSGKYVKVDDVMELINTSNRGSSDYFIVDQIEELCRSEKIYDVDAVVERLEKEKKRAFGLCLATNDSAQRLKYIEKEQTIALAIEIVKGGGVDGN